MQMCMQLKASFLEPGTQTSCLNTFKQQNISPVWTENLYKDIPVISSYKNLGQVNIDQKENRKTERISVECTARLAIWTRAPWPQYKLLEDWASNISLSSYKKCVSHISAAGILFSSAHSNNTNHFLKSCFMGCAATL